MSYGEIRSPENMRPRDAAPTGKAILSASWSMLLEDKQMFWLPVISAVGSLLAAAALFIPGYLLGRQVESTPHFGFYVGAALASFGASVVAIYFQAALVIAAYDRADGGTPTVGSALAATWKVKGKVLSWALLTTTVGMAIRAFEERLGWLGRILGFLGGLAWAIASFLVVPVLVAEGLGPVQALKRSAQLLRDTWGTSLRTTLRFGVIQVVAMLALMVGVIAGIALVIPGDEPARTIGILLLTVSIVGFLALATVVAAVSTYARALIYRYAAGLPTPGVDTAVFEGAFVAKKRRR
ncbi:hypothetical protein Back2_14090 [Nocardioides baekrokdamisoli]|uniref:Glycerophosphoryl diester phosphodiesterase membrane domain-containing protein n=1 Tax=Nocardioides baekrokdamisoli TaxID=1804624 RepID=A0A3G9IFK4_9ACTN|nr:DUF6159 family protein [Nocardioides baekrokdamisoli]BBH17122.1 hypothetical protein Back2_14090 [Nocardioides baekrokdamisoli]